MTIITLLLAITFGEILANNFNKFKNKNYFLKFKYKYIFIYLQNVVFF